MKSQAGERSVAGEGNHPAAGSGHPVLAEGAQHGSEQSAHDGADQGVNSYLEVPLDGLRAAAQSMPTIDLVGLGLLGLFALLGLMRGLWWQAMRFAGLAGAVLLARAVTPRLAPAAEARFEGLDPHLTWGLIWLLVFLAGLGVAAALGRLGRSLLDAMQLGLVDRCAGCLAGALTGLLLHAVLVAAFLQLAPRHLAAPVVAGSRSELLVGALVRPLPLIFDPSTSERVRVILAAPPADQNRGVREPPPPKSRWPAEPAEPGQGVR